MRRRSSTLELASFFFEPFQLHLEPADLLKQLLLSLLGLLGILVRLTGEHFRQPFRRLLLPLAHLNRVNLKLRRDGVDWLNALERFKINFGFQIWTVLTSFL